MSTVVIAPTAAASAAKTLPSTTTAASRAIRLWLGLVDGQGASPQIGSVERCDGLVGFTSISHFYKPKPTGLARISVGGALCFAALGAVVEAARELQEHGTFGYIDTSIATPDLNVFLRG